MVIRYNMGWYEMILIDVPLFFAADVLVLQLLHGVPARAAQGLGVALKYVPFLMSVGIGLSVNNTRAVVEALFNRKSEFTRTPKYHIEGDSDEWVGKKVPAVGRRAAAGGAGARALLHLDDLLCARQRHLRDDSVLVLFQVGFLYTGLLSIMQQYASAVGLESQKLEVRS
jgi:hypothetical protein